MKNIQFILGLICVITLIYSQGVCAAMTDAELARLPAYCKARSGKGTPAEKKYWSKRMGRDNFIHMHHYCGGLNLLNKSYGVVDKDTKERFLQRALHQFKYMQRMTSKDFYLRSEIANKAGNTFLRLGNVGESIREFSNGIKLNANYVLNYVGLSKVYKKYDDITKARGILEQGLKHNPSSKLLKKRLKRLGK